MNVQYLHIFLFFFNNCLSTYKIEKQNRTWGPIFPEKTGNIFTAELSASGKI